MTKVNVKNGMMMAIAASAVFGCGGAPARPPVSPTGAVTTSPEQKPELSNDQTRAQQVPSNQFWWPERLDLAPLRQHAAESDPMGADFKYAEAFKKLDLKAVKKDIAQVLATSQAWWPADY
ncbi:MAG: Catalase-peroxidase 2 precursor, partial [Pseudomonadota bacterium]